MKTKHSNFNEEFKKYLRETVRGYCKDMSYNGVFPLSKRENIRFAFDFIRSFMDEPDYSFRQAVKEFEDYWYSVIPE